jgi:probable nitrogen fixation protein
MIGVATDDPGAGFLAELVRKFRAQDEGGWDGRTDFQLLDPLLLPAVERKAHADDDDTDPDVFWRIEIFYSAVAAAVEHRTGLSCQLMLKMHHEGFGRLVLVTGRLVALSRYLREVHAFGFDSLEVLAEAGERLVSEAVEAIERFPEVARLGALTRASP